jgi:nucleoside-diphosphate-sugar epimerase
MNILITGSSGFLGKNLMYHFKKNNISVDTIGRHESDFLCNLESNSINLFKTYDLVIHCAGIAHVDSNSPSHITKNVSILNNLISCFYIKPKKFIFISSVSVYGCNEGLNIKENCQLKPKDNYGKSKLICENIISDWCVKEGVILTILRLPLIIGNYPVGNFKKMLNGIKYSSYFNINSGTAKRSMILVTDIYDIIIPISNIGGIYNMSDNNDPSYFDLSRIIAKLYKKKIYNLPYPFSFILAIMSSFFFPLIPFNVSIYRKMTQSLTFNSEKIQNTLNWQPNSVLNSIEDLIFD